MGMTESKPSVVLAVDLGTTSAKVLAFDAGGLLEGGTVIRARAEREYPLLSPLPGYAEQDPDLIAAAAGEAVREAAAAAGGAGTVLAVAFSTAMHALIAVDAEGRALTPSITWADLRAAGQARTLRASAAAHGLQARTGVPLHAMTPLAKLIWLREHRPGIFAQAHRFVGIKEYVLARWFGGSVPMDESAGGGTGLYSLAARAWDEEALRLAGIDADRLPALARTTHILTGMRPAAAEALGLAADVPVVLGAADGPLANLGGGALEPGIAAMTVGTSGAVRAAVRTPAADPNGRLFCYPLAEDLWVAGGPVNSGGVIFRWLRDKLAPDLAAGEGGGDAGYTRLTALAAQAPPGAEGLLFLPHLTGERAPHWDERARGAFFGLSLGHDRSHMIRAGLEGIVLGLRSVTDALAELTGEPRELRVSGGFARSPFLRQLMADVLGRTIAMTDSPDASAVGAARLALHALGRLPDLGEAAARTPVTERTEPDPARAAVYDEVYGMFSRLYARAADTFTELDAFRAAGRFEDEE